MTSSSFNPSQLSISPLHKNQQSLVFDSPVMFVAILFFALGAAARVLHSLSAVPSGWEFVGEASRLDQLSLRIALNQPHADALEEVTMQVSTPGHADYGRHLTREQLRSYTEPSVEAVRTVSSWLRRHGIVPIFDHEWILIRTTVGQANKLLSARFGWYRNAESNTAVLRTLSYSVPDDLAGFVDMVQPTTRFGQISRHRATVFDLQYLPSAKYAKSVAMAHSEFMADQQAANKTCGTTVTPACLRSLYGIKYTVTDPSDNILGFSSYLNEYARYDDLAAFTKNLLPEAADQKVYVSLVNGGKNNQTSTLESGEANLDLQYLVGMGHPLPIVEYSTGGLGPLSPTREQPREPGSNEPYLEFLAYMLALDDSELPQTLSTSYGEDEQSVPEEYARKVCSLFMQLGARGVSVLFSSGDSGPGKSCVRVSDNATYFQPTFPAGCPYVTSVGSTWRTEPEQAAYFSSGGFSSLHARPAWQDDVVSAYIDKLGNSTYAPYFNSSNRGFPDVAAQGFNFAVYDKGRLTNLSGTSASTPVFAGIVALLNAARKSQGMAPLGFLNPWLYRHSAALTDITLGSSIGCLGSRAFPSRLASWNATTGWDPVTGLGTPQFPALLEAALQSTQRNTTMKHFMKHVQKSARRPTSPRYVNGTIAA